jgi:hypothetical protein
LRDTRNLTGAAGTGSAVAAAQSAFDVAPGKRTLTEGLQPVPRAWGGEERTVYHGAARLDRAAPPPATGGSRSAPPTRIAEAIKGEPNAVLRVVVYNGAGEVIQRWESKGRWEGALP